MSVRSVWLSRGDVVISSSLPVVTLSTLTFRRPEDIAATLPLLVEQARSVPHDVEVLVVDNDTTDSARKVVEGFAPEVRYVHEPKPGIAAARNRVLSETADKDVVIFFDDDERPVTQWLQLLLETYEREHPTGVVGPVVSEYSQTPDEWIMAGRYFERLRHPTGTKVRVAATNNLLLDRQYLQKRGIIFDERFGLTGGSDTMLTRQITDGGGVLLWCDEAVVTDVVPLSRLTREWVTRRAFRSANGGIRVELELAGSQFRRFDVRVRSIIRGLARVSAGSGQWLAGVVTRKLAPRASGIRKIYRGFGMVSGAFGYIYAEYSRSKSARGDRILGRGKSKP